MSDYNPLEGYYPKSNLPMWGTGDSSISSPVVNLPAPKITGLKRALNILIDAGYKARSKSPLVEKWKKLLDTVPQGFVQGLIARELAPPFKLYPLGTLSNIVNTERAIRNDLISRFREYIPYGLENLSWIELLQWATHNMKKHEHLLGQKETDQ